MSFNLFRFLQPFIPQTKIESAKVNDQFNKIADSMQVIENVLKRTPVFPENVAFPSEANKKKVLGTDSAGAPAFFNVMESPTDTATSDALMPRGAFGVGGRPTVYANANTGSGLTEFIRYESGSINTPVPNSFFEGFRTGVPDFQLETVMRLRDVPLEPEQWIRQGSPSGSVGWRRTYHNGNILGTVSQSAGVPTGAIIQRGGNANGQFTRFADGTQFCWIDETPQASAVNNSYGGGFRSNLLNWTYPVAFSYPPNIGGTSRRAAAYVIPAQDITLSYVEFMMISVVATATVVGANMEATGRWFN